MLGNWMRTIESLRPNRATLCQERQDWDEGGMLGNRDLTVALVIEAAAEHHWTYGDQTCNINAFEVRICPLALGATSATCFKKA